MTKWDFRTTSLYVKEEIVSNSKKIKVFYSWQSDLPDYTNRSAIRKALRAAASEVEDSLSNLEVSIELDEATRNIPGSPNIPASILEKIEDSDIFIADVSTINPDAHCGRKIPNPNVVFELGYAVAHLGWNRVIMLVNSEHGDMSELPFDFDRHRASAYKLTEQSEKNDKKALVTLLRVAIESIITANPRRSAARRDSSPEETKRNRDIKNIRWALGTLHLPTLDQHVTDSPHFLTDKIIYFWEGFNGVILNSLFHLYDGELEKEFRCLHDAWRESTRYDQYYYSNSSDSLHVFGNIGDAPFSQKQQAAWDKIIKANLLISQTLAKILAIVRDRYIEIDVDDTNRSAWLEYIETERKNKALLDGEDS